MALVKSHQNKHLQNCSINKIKIKTISSLKMNRLLLSFIILHSIYSTGSVGEDCGWRLNPIFNFFNMGNLVPCCQEHKTCYETCNSTKLVCDSKLFKCNQQACSNSTVNLCGQVSTAMFKAVQIFGFIEYENAQIKCIQWTLWFVLRTPCSRQTYCILSLNKTF